MHTQLPSLDGILLVDKPANCTSHDMVDFVRKKFRFKKVGHCGTLDPLATGLIILTLERGTKIQDLLMSEDKVYEGTLELGKVTDTQDAQGKVIEEHLVPSEIADQIPQAFKKFSGDFYQLPPMVSAIKKGGVPLYKLARQGKVIERQPRLVHVYRYEIQRVELPEVDFLVECSKGFYVRTYCHDIGETLKCGAHLKKLRRTRSGNFNVQNALTYNQLEAMETLESLSPHIISLPEVSRIRRS
jgi:tRNA pseudouridine55 synthase